MLPDPAQFFAPLLGINPWQPLLQPRVVNIPVRDETPFEYELVRDPLGSERLVVKPF